MQFMPELFTKLCCRSLHKFALASHSNICSCSSDLHTEHKQKFRCISKRHAHNVFPTYFLSIKRWTCLKHAQVTVLAFSTAHPVNNILFGIVHQKDNLVLHWQNCIIKNLDSTIYLTRSYAALRAADLDWIVGPGYSLGRVHSGEKQWKTNLEPWKTNLEPWKTM